MEQSRYSAFAQAWSAHSRYSVITIIGHPSFLSLCPQLGIHENLSQEWLKKEMLLARFCSTLSTHSCPNRASSAGLLCATNPCSQKSLAEWASRHSRAGRFVERTDFPGSASCCSQTSHCELTMKSQLLPDRFGQRRKMRSSLSFLPPCVRWSGPRLVSLC